MIRIERTPRGELASVWFVMPLPGNYLGTPESNAFAYFMFIAVVEGLTRLI